MADDKPVLFLIEDDEAVRGMMRACVEDLGDVRECVSIAEAHSALKGTKPDVVILDLDLPDGSGEDLIAEIPRDAAIVTVTASHRILSEPGRVVSHVPKPFDPATLRSVVSLALSGRQP